MATIKLTVPRAMIARIELFDVTGRRVKEVWSGAVADTKTVTWQADDFASGLYFVRAWDTLGNRPMALAKVVLLR
ncbi:T9SS type A sorting domain-containing protein [bacterium]|nr:T9SS type A sorting domain-containing protein [bacterium]